MQDIGAFGLKVTLTASVTFPSGIVLTQFPDDTDPLDMASIQIADKASGLNGDLVTWSKATPVPLSLSVIPGTEDDINLSLLANANRVARGRTPARDVITATVSYPDGTSVRLIKGKITDAVVGRPVSSAGRMKTKVYQFVFEDIQE